MSPLAASQRRKLVSQEGDVSQSECIQFIYIIFTAYIQPMKVSSMLGSLWMAPFAWRFEVPAVCSTLVKC